MSMWQYWQRRKIRKQARHLAKGAQHVLRMRADLMAPALVARIEGAIARVLSAARGADMAALQLDMDQLNKGVGEHLPPLRWPALRENVEVITVAIAVAMAFRAYFIQPFKIPTGSMQPTLFGVQSVEHRNLTWLDRQPFSGARWLLTGMSFTTVRAAVSGYLADRIDHNDDDPVHVGVFIGGVRHQIPRQAVNQLRPGAFFRKGEILWRGRVILGDHVFVNKLIWHFRRPRRGEVMVFNTDGIADLPAGTHYIKRMVGLPGDDLSIAPPRVCTNGAPIAGIAGIDRVATRSNGYAGYTLAYAGSESRMKSPDAHIQLGADEFFALGDNTLNSRDSRYWGTVPRRNLVGPAFMVYWPLSRRWGLIE